MFKKILLILLFSSFSYAIIVQDSGDDRQKQEILRLKQELNDFYNQKESEYLKQKSELEELLSKIEKTKVEIEEIKEQNQQILDDIKTEVSSKTTSIYNNMKPKSAAEIFDKMIDSGKIQDVFDIIVTLKTKNATDIIRLLKIENAAIITNMMQDFSKVNN
ncbi:MAG: hypothetical protein RBQ81_01955 [Arcobacteraceae bacterium]|nr:hypothetical protein [Arcobacteraceae bacterium]MDY0364608.1 hypothetical protein [Arcobacteraceae bacterium]